jgi:hypothetical protein
MLGCVTALLQGLCNEERTLPADFWLMHSAWYFDCVRPYRASAGELAV